MRSYILTEPYKSDFGNEYKCNISRTKHSRIFEFEADGDYCISRGYIIYTGPLQKISMKLIKQHIEYSTIDWIRTPTAYERYGDGLNNYTVEELECKGKKLYNKLKNEMWKLATGIINSHDLTYQYWFEESFGKFNEVVNSKVSEFAHIDDVECYSVAMYLIRYYKMIPPNHLRHHPNHNGNDDHCMASLYIKYIASDISSEYYQSDVPDFMIPTKVNRRFHNNYTLAEYWVKHVKCDVPIKLRHEKIIYHEPSRKYDCGKYSTLMQVWIKHVSSINPNVEIPEWIRISCIKPDYRNIHNIDEPIYAWKKYTNLPKPNWM